MTDKINELLRRVEEFKPKAAAEIEEFRIRILGKKGELTALMEEFKTVAPELKRELGQQLNRLKNEATERINALREQVDCVLRGIDEKLSMHDFRVVDGERQINLIFDVVVPFSYDDEGKRRLLMTIYDDLKAIDQRFNPVVTLDHAM